MTSPAAQTARQTDRAAQIDRGVSLKPQPLAENADRIEQLTILLAEIQATGDAVTLFQIAEMALGKGKRLVGC